MALFPWLGALYRVFGYGSHVCFPVPFCGISSLIFINRAQLSQDNPAEAGLN